MQRAFKISLGVLLGLTLVSGVSVLAYAEGEISGKYRNSVAGYEITLPKGWSGIEFLGISVLAAPGGFDFFKPTPEVQMMVLHFNTTIFKDVQNITKAEQNASDDCKEIFKRYVSINKFRVYQVLEECTTNGEYAKKELYYFGKNDYLIGATFSGNSTEAFEKKITLFEQSVKTLKIDKQADIKKVLAKISGTKTLLQKVDNKTIKIETSSTLTEFKFDKAKKAFSFTAEGRKDVRGLTEVSIGGLLKGAYKVMIDGRHSKDFNIIEDTTTKEILVSFNHDHKTKHIITISGTK